MIPLDQKYQPTTIRGFVGLERPRALLGALAANPYPSAWLLLGPSGTGKTTMALALCSQIGAELQHVPSRQCDLERVTAICQRCWYSPMFGGWHFVLVDEADQMSLAAQNAFLSTLDTTARPPNAIFVFTANNPKPGARLLLQDRFLSRVRTLRFSAEADSMAAFLARVWTAEGPPFAAPDFLRIARASKLNIRDALMRLELEMIAPDPFEADTAAVPPTVINIDAQYRKRQESAKRAWITIRARRTAARGT